MSSPPATFAEDVINRPAREQLEVFIDEHRAALHGCLDGLTEEQGYRDACAASRRATAPLGLDDLVHGNRRGPLPLRWVYFHFLREIAQHCGHADILREQILGE